MWKKNSVDPDQLASSEASRSGSTLCSKRSYSFEIVSLHSALIRSSMVYQNKVSCGMVFPLMWYMKPAKPQISLRIRAV